ncbi:glycosyltransferase [Chloroflexota bacterium]
MRILLVTLVYNEWSAGYRITRALKELGHEVKTLDYRFPFPIKNLNVHGYFLDQLFYGYLQSRNNLMELWSKYVNRLLLRKVSQWIPDVVLVSKGEIIYPDTIRRIRKEIGSKTINWTFDDPALFNSLHAKIMPAYDYVFTNSQECVPLYNKLGIDKVKFLPYGCDPSIHKFVSLSESELEYYGSDIYLPASMDSKRVEVLTALSTLNLRIKTSGPGWDRLPAGHPLRKYWIRRLTHVTDYIKALNAAKIGLNLQKTALALTATTDRLWEITGCGTILFTEYVSGLESFFEIGSEVVCFHDTQELRELIDYYLDNPEERQKIARKGQERCHRDHSIKNRVSEILSYI